MRSGELAFLLEPDLKEARGGLRDANAIHAVAAAWVAPGPGPRVRAAQEFILDARHALHEVTGRNTDRLVLQEQDEVARVLELLDADALLRRLAGAGRTVAYALDQSFRQAQRSRGGRPGTARNRLSLPGGLTRRGPQRISTHRRPLAEGLVEQDGEVVLARSADPASDPVLVLRAAAAAAEAGLALAPRTLARLTDCPPLPVPWPAEAQGRAGRPARCRAGGDRRLGGPRPGGAHHPAAAGLGAGAQPPAAQPAAHLHRGPASGGDGGTCRRAHPDRGPARPAPDHRAAARHRQGLAGRPPADRRGGGQGHRPPARPAAPPTPTWSPARSATICCSRRRRPGAISTIR